MLSAELTCKLPPLFKPIEMTNAGQKTADIPIIMSIEEYNEWAKEQ